MSLSNTHIWLCRKVKTLADSDDDEDNVLSWVKKSRKIEVEREKAEQRVC